MYHCKMLLITTCQKIQRGAFLCLTDSQISFKWLDKQKSIPLKMVRYRTGLIMKKGTNVQKKTFKDLQKAWRTNDQNHFKRLEESLLGSKYEEMRGGSTLSHSTVDKQNLTLKRLSC